VTQLDLAREAIQMAIENIVHPVSQFLFSERGVNVFAVLDGASVPDLPMRLYRHRPEHFCLYRGELAPDMAEVAPYLVRLEPAAEFTDWVIGRGWGQHWGVFAVSDAAIRELRRHFRRFLIVHDSNGKPLIFRYYDPRVLRVYLPTCNTEELATVFGPVVNYILEDEHPNTALRFRAVSGALRQEKLQIA
jgi:hypothetical protein